MEIKKESVIMMVKGLLIMCLVVAFLISAEAVQAKEGSPMNIYKEVLLVTEQAFIAREKGEYTIALTKYNNARYILELMKKDYPNWKMMILVDMEIERCNRAINLIRRRLKEKGLVEYEGEYIPPQEIRERVRLSARFAKERMFLKDKIANLDQSLKKLEEDLEKSTEDQAQLREGFAEERASLQNRISELTKSTESLTTSLSQLQQQRKTYLGQIKEDRGRFKDSDQHRARLEGELSQLRAQLSRAQQDNLKAQKQTEEILAQTKEDKAELLRTLAKQRTKIAELKEAGLEDQEEMEQTLAQLQKDKLSLEDKIANLNESLEKLEEDKKTYLARIDRDKVELEGLDKEKAKLEEEKFDISLVDKGGLRLLGPRVVEKDLLAKVLLSGILWDKKVPLAIINRKIVKIGDMVGAVEGMRVDQIKKNSVILDYQGEKFEVRLKRRRRPSYRR